MNTAIAIIIGMATATVGSAVTEKLMTAAGKTDEAGYLNLATKCGLAVTSLTIFASVIKALSKL